MIVNIEENYLTSLFLIMVVTLRADQYADGSR